MKVKYIYELGVWHYCINFERITDPKFNKYTCIINKLQPFVSFCKLH